MVCLILDVQIDTPVSEVKERGKDIRWETQTSSRPRYPDKGENIKYGKRVVRVA